MAHLIRLNEKTILVSSITRNIYAVDWAFNLILTFLGFAFLGNTQHSYYKKIWLAQIPFFQPQSDSCTICHWGYTPYLTV